MKKITIGTYLIQGKKLKFEEFVMIGEKHEQMHKIILAIGWVLW